MKSKEITVSSKDIAQIKQDVELIKNHLLKETELTDWAKQELEKARNSSRESYVSHEEVKKMILSK